MSAKKRKRNDMPVAMSYHSNRQDFLDELVGFSEERWRYLQDCSSFAFLSLQQHYFWKTRRLVEINWDWKVRIKTPQRIRKQQCVSFRDDLCIPACWLNASVEPLQHKTKQMFCFNVECNPGLVNQLSLFSNICFLINTFPGIRQQNPKV